MRQIQTHIFHFVLVSFFLLFSFGKNGLLADDGISSGEFFSFANQTDCGLFVDIGSACLVPCDSTEFFVKYENLDENPVAGTFIEITLDTAISMGESNFPFSDLGDNRFRFDLGTLAIGEMGGVSFTAFVDCNAELGQVHVTEAHIFPDDLCPPSPDWDGSEVEVEIDCQGDSIFFKLENVGDGDMSEPSQFFIIEDDVVIMLQGYQLPSGGTTTIVLPNSGGGYHFEAAQTEGSPNGFFDNISTEGCENISAGFVEQFSEADLNLAIDIYNRACQADCEGIEKLAFPEGYGAENFIGQNLPIEYQFNFENTTSDTVTQITICDTLSLALDISTALPGASSHPYVTDFPGGNVVKFVFDDIVLPPGETGFVNLTACQEPDNPPGTVIPNTAVVIMEEDTVFTNEVFHTIPNMGVTTLDTTFCGEGEYFGIPVNESTTIETTNQFSIFLNQLNVNITYFEGTEDETVTAEICEGESFEIDGVEYTQTGIYEIPMTDPDGCPYTLTLDLTVIENNEVVSFVETCLPDTIQFFGQTLDETDTYSHVEVNDEGCYDIFILNLTVFPSFENVTEVAICEGETFEWEGQIFAETTSASVGYSTADGCDSTLSLELEVLPAPDTTFEVEIMEGETFEFNGETLFETGEYVFDFPLPNGCDSSVIVILTVLPPNGNCVVEAGADTLVCGFSTDLIGSPEMGTWEAICPGSSGFVDMDILSDSSVNVTVSKCGTYFFRYSFFGVDSLMVFDSLLMDSVLVLDTCQASDVVKVKFEDPSLRELNAHVNLNLEYNDYECPEDGFSPCSNVFPYELVPPDAKWLFARSGNCSTQIFGTSVDSLLGDCLVNEIEVSSLVFNESFFLDPVCIPQDSFIIIDSNGMVTANNLLNLIALLNGQSLDSLNCPEPPSGCFASVGCEPDTVGMDTVILEVPIRIGGHWAIWLDGMPTPLDDTTSIAIDSVDYAFIVNPNSEAYSPVEFEIWEIIGVDTMVVPSQSVSVTLSWEEIWTLDTLEIIKPIYGPTPEGCCERGDFISSTFGAMPGIPAYECPPFTITFDAQMLVVEEDILCDSTSYILELTMLNGTPPYTVEGVPGTMTSTNVFTSDPIPMTEGYEVAVVDSNDCDAMLIGEPCPCVQLDAISPPTAEIPCDTACVVLEGTGDGNVPFDSKWQMPNGAEVSGTSVLACQPGTYLFIVFDSISACEDTSETVVSLAYIEAIAEVGNALDCVNASAQLLGNAEPGEPGVVFEWEGSGILPGEENFQNPTVEEAGWYFLTVTNPANGCVDMDSVEVVENMEMPSANIDPPANITCQNSMVELLGFGSTPSGQISFEWVADFGNIVGPNDVQNIFVDNAGEYTLTVTHLESGCTSQASVIVDFDFTPPANVSAGSDGQLDCATDSLILQGSAGSGNYNFQWTTSSGNIVSGNFTPTPVVDMPGTYTFYVVNLENGCSASEEVEVTLDTLPPLIQFAEADTLTCVAHSTLLDGGLSGVPILFSNGKPSTEISFREMPNRPPKWIPRAGIFLLCLTPQMPVNQWTPFSFLKMKMPPKPWREQTAASHVRRFRSPSTARLRQVVRVFHMSGLPCREMCSRAARQLKLKWTNRANTSSP